MFRPFQLMGEHVVAFLPLEGQAQAVRVEDREASGFRTIGAILVTIGHPSGCTSAVSHHQPFRPIHTHRDASSGIGVEGAP